MISETWLLSSLSTIAVAALAVVILLYSGGGVRGRMLAAVSRAVVTVVTVTVLAGVVLLLCDTLGISAIALALAVPLSAATAFAAVLVTLPLRRVGCSRQSTFVFSGLVGLLIVIPVTIAIFSDTGVLFRSFATLDLAGGLPILQTAGVAASVVLVSERRALPHRLPQRASWQMIVAVLVTWALWLGWLVGMELAFDDVTPRILVNALVAPTVSAAAWLLVQRLRHDATTLEAGVAGLVAGLAAITAACGYVDVVGAAVIGAVAGALGSVIAHSLVHRAAATAWLIPVALSIGSGTGIVALGIFSTRVGLAYTGQPELLFSQVASGTVVAVYTMAVSSVLWRIVRYLTAHTAPST